MAQSGRTLRHHLVPCPRPPPARAPPRPTRWSSMAAPRVTPAASAGPRTRSQSPKLLPGPRLRANGPPSPRRRRAPGQRSITARIAQTRARALRISGKCSPAPGSPPSPSPTTNRGLGRCWRRRRDSRKPQPDAETSGPPDPSVPPLPSQTSPEYAHSVHWSPLPITLP